MSLRVVRRHPTGPIAVCYLVGSHMDPELRDALPGCAIVATDQAPLQGVDLGAARSLAGAGQGAPLVLVGYSAGCQPVRAHLVAGVQPAAVVTIDGTHGSLPPAQWQLDVWRQLAARARAGRCVWVATCTRQRYTERLPKGAFTSTSHLLSAALGLPQLLDDRLYPAMPRELADDAYPGVPLRVVDDGGLLVLAYPGADIDAAAHRAQQRIVLPAVLRDHVAGHLGIADTEPAPPPSAPPEPAQAPPWRDPGLTLGERCVLWSESQLSREDAEERPPGSNAGPYVAWLLSRCERDGRPLHITAGNYCSAGASTAMLEALLPGESAPHRPRAGVVELVQDALASGCYVPGGELRAGYRLETGDLLVWDRSVPGRADTSWWRHVGRVVAETAGGWDTIEANAGTRRAWARMVRHRADPRLLGAITYPGQEAPPSLPEVDRSALAAAYAHHLETERRVWAGESGADAIEAALTRRG